MVTKEYTISERRLAKIQQPILLTLTRAYRTAHTAALQVLAGVPPLELKLFPEHNWCNFKNGTTLKLYGKRYNIKYAEQDLDAYSHPRRSILPKWDKESPQRKVIYYTDG